ncbi:probable DEAD/DEAH box helicase [Natronomonas pharaonis DSM 2160]|uniref:Probable DEAD/DEAH box helicase n=1 Tax=Natronomonas pharaonis (strain ATCC 35678 / DSM 2160 / CIP 103997 / JCM 8858 / NBRC 14720 / NCIMB 2260 / Gabara) TaxID=348780 RepID=A0A1U7EXH1_NATPD|nr:DEAD/DEAH box helicase [Natronomonas pharaonis]CAI49872.1 probable DEAD/DEAH box helicase [Natronomonas pharaonis DSM 2160]
MSSNEPRRHDVLSEDALTDSFPDYTGQVTASEHRSARKADTVPAERVLRPELASRLDNDLYRHQAAGLNALADGENVVATTATSSGKTRIYALQMARNQLASPDATALCLYPMKALTRDQEQTLNDRFSGWDVDTRVEVYDGDTKPERKPSIRTGADTILTNPAGLNVYLPRHGTDSGWSRFYSNLELVVVDEAHQYSGIMGTHVAWILRRLRRLLFYYGADPQFVLTTATIGNPAQHAARLTGEAFTVIDEDGSPRGERDIVLWKPPIDEDAVKKAHDADIDPTEADMEEFRASTGGEAAKVTAHLAVNERQTLQFCTARQGTEIAARKISAAARDHPRDSYIKTRAYHGGLGKRTRRSIETQLKDGSVDAVASTNALELGIDVGGIDATVTSGYPGTRQSFWQQVGRAGRGTSDALSVLVGGADAMDSYILDNPKYLFEDDVENAVVSIDNEQVYADHLCVAARERPLTDDDAGLLGDERRLQEMVAMWQDAGVLEQGVGLDSGVHYTGDSRPESRISMYDTSGRQYIVDCRDGDIDHDPVAKERAARDYHEGALFLHDGQQYEVVEVTHDAPAPRITVEERNTGRYTRTLSQKHISNLRPETSRELGDGYTLWFGRGDVDISYDQYVVHNISTGELESGPHPTGSPPLSLDTELMWVSLPETHLEDTIAGLDVPLLEPTEHAKQDVGITEPDRYTYAGGIHAAEHGIIQLAPLELLIDNSDIGGLSTPAHHDERIPGPVWFVHDGIDGGIGFSRAIYDNFETIAERTYEHLDTCDCQRRRGCPLCIMSEHCGNQNDPLDRVVGRQIIGDVVDRL